MRPVLANDRFHSRASVWGAVRGIAPALRSPVAIAACTGLVLAIVVLGRAPRPLPLAVGAAVAAYLLTAPYVLPWYAMWALPVLALAWRTRLAAVVATFAGALTLAHLDLMAVQRGALQGVLRLVATVMLPASALVALIWLVRASRQEPGVGGESSYFPFLTGSEVA